MPTRTHQRAHGGLFVVLVPLVGAFSVAFLVKNFSPEAEDRGVMNAVCHRA
jgi:H+/Cl- antiporter ClcA